MSEPLSTNCCRKLTVALYSWRIVKDWVEAQMAIVEPKMVQIEQVFLPYAIMPDGRTLYERVRETQFVLPPAETKET